MKMNNKYQNELDAIIKEAQKDALREVVDRLQHRWDQIDRILSNGHPIWIMMHGDRFERMRTLRMNLITKMVTICEVQGMLFNFMYKK